MSRMRERPCLACYNGARHRILQHMNGRQMQLEVGQPYDPEGRCHVCGTAAADVLLLVHDAVPVVEEV